MANLDTPQDYLDAGVEPPEQTVHDFQPQIDNHIHEWKAIGNFIECTKGHHIHGMPYDHLNNIFIGTSPEGAPLFQKLDLSDQPDNNSL